jgi:hypothetical protein
MRYTPNTLFPFQKLKFGQRVVFWKILAKYYDSPGGRFNSDYSDLNYIVDDFDDVDDELLNIARRYLDLGYCPAIDINQNRPSSGVTCLIDARWIQDF